MIGPLQVIDHDGDRSLGREFPHHLEQVGARGEGRLRRAVPIGRQSRPGHITGGLEQLADEAELQVGLGLIGSGGQHLEAVGAG